MNRLSPRLLEGYRKDLKDLPTERFPSNFTQYEDVLRAHYLICDYFEDSGGTESLYGIKNMNMLCSAVARQVVEFGGRRKWNDDFEVAATLFFGLVKNHPFHDGNKRTALLSLLNHLLSKMNRIPDAPQKEFEEMTVLVAESNWKRLCKGVVGLGISSSEETDMVIRFIARKLRKMTRQLDKRFHPVTYAELESTLKQHGFFFKNPYHNAIEVWQRRKKMFLGVFKSGKTEEVKWGTIGYPGMKRQVSRESLKDILKMLKLDERHGFDKKSIFEGAEPMYKLIQDYEGPLKRLRDK